jgi:cation transport ATPase
MRIRWQALSDAGCAMRLAQSLAALPGIQSTAHKPDAASLIVCYDPKKLAAEAIEAELDAFCEAEEAQKRKARQKAGRPNRLAKAGMLLSLAASLSFIAARQKKSHALWGAVFLLFLAIHLLHHRARLMQ